jgi:transposase
MGSQREASQTKARRQRGLEVIRGDVAGVDLGARQHWVCGPALESGEPNVKCFGTTTAELEEVCWWLIEQGVTSVAMESTSVYWIPLYEMLESKGVEPVLVNARQLHGVPGRKTDMIDCQWIQKLHSCGLLRGSFRPNEAICKLRALRRQRWNLSEERTRAVHWMQKALDQMNVQVHHAVTDLTGSTGMSIVRAIVDGERDPQRLAELRDRRCKKSVSQIAEHLKGHWREEHLFNLKMALDLYDHVVRSLETYDSEIARLIREMQPPGRRDEELAPHPTRTKEKAIRARGEQPLRTDLWRLTGLDATHIDGISPTSALDAIAEIGFDLSAFPTERHFVSWLRLTPPMNISAGKVVKKRRNAATASRVAHTFRLAAVSVQRSQTALGAYYRRVARRKGAKVAVLATARKIATLFYRMLRYGQDYVDEGADAYEARFAHKRLQAIISSAHQLGFHLVPLAELTPIDEVSA